MRKEITGGWIDLRDPKMVPERLRRPVIAKGVPASRAASNLEKSENPEHDLDVLFSYNDLVAIALIQAWSFDAPVSVDGMLDLPGAVVDEIREITAPMLNELLPDFEPDPSEGSPTAPSGE